MDKDRQPPTRRSPPAARRSQVEILCAGVGWIRLATIYPGPAEAEAERAHYLTHLGRLPRDVRVVPADH